MPSLHTLRDDERGVTLIELMAVLAILLVLVAIAIPTFGGFTNQAKDAEAKAELRQALVPVKAVNIEVPNAPDLETRVLEMSPGTSFDSNALLGVKLAWSTDGAICLWRISDSETVYGVWEPPFSQENATLFAELSSIPASCPTAADAPAAGFTRAGW